MLTRASLQYRTWPGVCGTMRAWRRRVVGEARAAEGAGRVTADSGGAGCVTLSPTKEGVSSGMCVCGA